MKNDELTANLHKAKTKVDCYCFNKTTIIKKFIAVYVNAIL